MQLGVTDSGTPMAPEAVSPLPTPIQVIYEHAFCRKMCLRSDIISATDQLSDSGQLLDASKFQFHHLKNGLNVHNTYLEGLLGE